MDTAVINLAAIVRDYKQWAQSTVRPSAGAKRLLRALLFRENMISNLNFRAKAFVHRMNNEIKCVSDIFRSQRRDNFEVDKAKSVSRPRTL